MTDLEALKESISNKLFAQEPLAQAIMFHLNKSDPAVHREILDTFDKIISNRIDSLIKESIENENAIEKYPR